MKRSDGTEMDRLLRRHARRGGEALRAEGHAGAEAHNTNHLDADEMNAYAEGAVPEAARSRYFAHLADCDSCRKLVTELTLASHRANEEKERVASLVPTPSKSWRERLAVIFSPAVLRYGVPAVALFAVIVIAIVAMRTDRKEPGVALNTEQSRYSPDGVVTSSNTASSSDTTTTTTGNHANSNAAPLAAGDIEQQQPSATATPAPPANPGQMQDAAPVLAQTPVPNSTIAPGDDAKDGPGEYGKNARREQPEGVASAPAAAAPPPAPKSADTASVEESEASNRDKREEQKKNKVGVREDSDEVSIAGNAGSVAASQRVANEPRGGVGRTTTARAEQGEARKRPATAIKSSPTATDAMTEKESSTETVSVGGRRFRKQGGAWVDTAYNSSRSTTNVARGSEQYRALVADEPSLRTFAEKLSGEVIVVWKSRAYRFY